MRLRPRPGCSPRAAAKGRQDPALRLQGKYRKVAGSAPQPGWRGDVRGARRQWLGSGEHPGGRGRAGTAHCTPAAGRALAAVLPAGRAGLASCRAPAAGASLPRAVPHSTPTRSLSPSRDPTAQQLASTAQEADGDSREGKETIPRQVALQSRACADPRPGRTVQAHRPTLGASCAQKNSRCPLGGTRSSETSGLFTGDLTVPGEQSFPFCLGKHGI